MAQNKINDKDQQVLKIVADNEPVRSKTITETLYWADTTKDVNYRLSKLEETGLIERKQQEDSKFPINPKVSWITEQGHKELTELDESQPRGMEERVSRMEKQVSTMGRTYAQIKKRIVDIEDRLNKIEETQEAEYEELYQKVKEIRQIINADDEITISPDDFSF